MGKRFDPEDLTALSERYHDYLEDAPVSGKVCPVCGSGSGPNGTGLTYDKGLDGHWRYTCWNCGAGNGFHNEDCFHLVGRAEGISNFVDQVHAVEGLTGLRARVIGGDVYRSESYKSDSYKSGTLDIDRTAYYESCHNCLIERYDELKAQGVLRGLSLKTLKRFKVGYDPRFIADQVKGGYNPGYYAHPALIVPIASNVFHVWDTRPINELSDAAKRYRKQKQGPLNDSFLNFQALWRAPLVFVVEGEFDALSIIEAGYEAIALSSVSRIKTFVEAIDREKRKPRAKIVIALDSESDPKKAAEIEAKGLALKAKLDIREIGNLIAFNLWGE